MSGSKFQHDYYAILEIPQSADANTLKASYRRLAKARHPDKNNSATATSDFQLLQEAYSVLSDPVKRSNYDGAYAQASPHSTTSHHSKPRTTNTSTSDKNKAEQELEVLQIQLQFFRTQLSAKEKELSNAEIRLQALTRELAGLQRGIEDIMRKQAEEKTMWAYFASFFSANNAQEAEEKKKQQDFERLQKIAARSIKENTVKQQSNIVQVHKRAMEDIRGSIRSIEMKIRVQEEQERWKIEEERRRKEEEMLRQRLNKMRQQEAKRAQEAAEEREKRAKESYEAEQARHRQNSFRKETCLHRGWWDRVDGRIFCSCCLIQTHKFAFKCPGCAKLACATCRDSLKGIQPKWNKPSGARANTSWHSSFDPSSDWY